MRVLLTLLLLVLAPVAEIAHASAGPDHAVTRSLAGREARLSGNGGTGPYALGESFVVPGSERVMRGGRLLAAGLDYTLDADAGLITLSQPLLPGQEVRVAFDVIPFRLERSYRHRAPVVEEGAGPRPASQGAARVPGEGSGAARTGGAGPTRSGAGGPPGALAGLSIGGTKTISLGAGTGRDLAVDQELSLTISGRLTPDVEVRALLSDRNLPIQPEGTTRELDRLDQVRVEVIGPRGDVALGDYEMSLGAGTEFVPFSRELQGVRARYAAPSGGVSAGTAIARGRWKRQEFMGLEGRQGPYALTDDAGSAEIVVLAGSESVWLDGRELTRGEENDYTIDYSRGRIEFTRRHLITAESRVAVDFQFANEAFRRNLVFGSAERKSAGGRLRIAGLTLREADDSGVTRGAPLTGTDRELLESSGDAEVFAPGWQRTDSLRGEYTIGPPPDSTGDSLLVYVGPGAGDYHARFTQVAMGAGTYVRRYDDAALRYYFEYSPGGDHVPRVRVVRPRSLALGDLRAEFTPRPGLVFTGEFAGSRDDRNTLSSKDDGDNGGRAVGLAGELRALALGAGGRSLGRLTVAARLRDVDAGFAAPGATAPAFYGADWNLQGAQRDASGVSTTGEERLREMRLEYLPVGAVTLRASAGMLGRAAGLRSRRWEAGAETRWPPGGTLGLTGSRVTTDRGDTTGVADLLRATAERALGRAYTGAGFVRDTREDRAGGLVRRGYGFREGSALLGYGQREGTHAEAAVRVRRNREVRAGAWKDQSLAREGTLAAAWSRGATGNLAARFTRRDVDVDPGAEGSDSRHDLAEVTMHDLIAPRSVSSDFAYRISNTSEDTSERRFVRVGPGADYDSLGNYMPGEGAFAPIRVTTGSQPVTAVELSMRVRRPGRAGRIGGESFLAVEERSREPDRWRLYLLQPSVLQQEGVSLFGRVQLRQDLTWNEGGDPVSVRLRVEHRRERDFRVLNHSVARRNDRQELRLRGAPVPGMTLEGAMGHAKQVSSVEGGAAGSAGEEDLASWDLRADARHQLTRALELEAAAAGATHRDRVSGRRLRSAELGPGASYAVSGRVRVEGGFTVRASSGFEGGALPVSGFGVIQRGGVEWRAAADYRVSRTIQGTLRYNGSNLEGRPVEHRGNVEFRAYF